MGWRVIVGFGFKVLSDRFFFLIEVYLSTLDMSRKHNIGSKTSIKTNKASIIWPLVLNSTTHCINPDVWFVSGDIYSVNKRRIKIIFIEWMGGRKNIVRRFSFVLGRTDFWFWKLKLVVIDRCDCFGYPGFGLQVILTGYGPDVYFEDWGCG